MYAAFVFICYLLNGLCIYLQHMQNFMN